MATVQYEKKKKKEAEQFGGFCQGCHAVTYIFPLKGHTSHHKQEENGLTLSYAYQHPLLSLGLQL